MVNAKVVGHDICTFVYFHSIVFCLDFHWNEQYLKNEEGNGIKTKEEEGNPV